MSHKSDNVSSTPTNNIDHESLITKPANVNAKSTVHKFRSSSSEKAIKSSNLSTSPTAAINRARSWCDTKKYVLKEKVDMSLGECSSSPEPESMEDVSSSNLSRARGSLESLVKDEGDTAGEELRCAPSTSSPRNSPEAPISSPMLNTTFKQNSQFWTRFGDKKGRRIRKDVKRKGTKGKSIDRMRKGLTNCSIPAEGKSCLVNKDIKDEYEDIETLEDENTYKYKYFPKNSKSVLFTNEVFVVYFNGDEVVSESKEPLKKDVEQQVRNKEMRLGHLMKTQRKYNLCLY